MRAGDQHRARTEDSRTASPGPRPALGLPSSAGRCPRSRAPRRSATCSGASACRVAGRVHSVRVPTRTDTANLECTLADGTGSILLVFQGRRQVPGLQQGARVVAEGMVGAWNGRSAMLNPDYELLAGADGRRHQLLEAVTSVPEERTSRCLPCRIDRPVGIRRPPIAGGVDRRRVLLCPWLGSCHACFSHVTQGPGAPGLIEGSLRTMTHPSSLPKGATRASS